MESPKAYTVTAITRLIKNTLESSFNSIWVEGEVSNFLHHSSGHRYLNLKDSGAVIKLTIWRSIGSRLKFEPENGQKVLVFGDIAVYEKGGSYQLNVKKILPVGTGPLELAFRQLHAKLSAEGLFDEDRKQTLPKYPSRVGIVTSPTGAAIRDIINIARRRNKNVELVIYPAAVQGDGAEDTIAAGIKYFNESKNVDLIITGRGGGSLEDLWPFNTEAVVRAIAASKLPVISAVGHEIDTTLSDMVADLRAPTPSAAAEIAVWSRDDYLEQVSWHLRRQASLLSGLVRQGRQLLKAMTSRGVLARPEELISQRQQYLDNIVRHMATAGKNRFERSKNRLSLLASRLDALSPLKTLARGYTVCRKLPEKNLVISVRNIAVGDRTETIMTDGIIFSSVESIEKAVKNDG